MKHARPTFMDRVITICEKFGEIADGAECAANSNEVKLDKAALHEELRKIELRVAVIREQLALV